MVYYTIHPPEDPRHPLILLRTLYYFCRTAGNTVPEKETSVIRTDRWWRSTMTYCKRSPEQTTLHNPW